MQSQKKAYKGLGMEGVIADWYAKNTRRDLSRFIEGARRVAERVPPGAWVLEVAPGPGYMAIEIAKSGRHVSTLDVSKSFVEIARANARNAEVDLDIQHGDAAAMPFANDSFDFVICMAAFKNFTDPVGALNEIHRVLKPGAGASIIDLRKDASQAEIQDEIDRMRLSFVNALVTRWTFQLLLLKRAYRREELEAMAAKSRFGGCQIISQGIGAEMQLTKSASPLLSD
jgi:ubiquinone/menaquinone biosynthesis C-methylase UbiE